MKFIGTHLPQHRPASRHLALETISSHGDQLEVDPGAQLGNIIVVAAFRIISFLILPVKGEVKKKKKKCEHSNWVYNGSRLSESPRRIES